MNGRIPKEILDLKKMIMRSNLRFLSLSSLQNPGSNILQVFEIWLTAWMRL